MTKKKLIAVLRQRGFQAGRLIAMSKSGYCRQFPTHLVVFNAKICSRHGILLTGTDVDLTLDGEELNAVARLSCEDLYVLQENRPSMFFEGKLSLKTIANLAVWRTQTHSNRQTGSRAHNKLHKQ
jgi:hypothetical protein